MDGISVRFLELLKDSGMTKADFALKMGISQAVLTHIGSGRNKPGTELLVSALQHFPKINAEWLICGTGSKQKENNLEGTKQELLKLLEEIKLLNQMNYNNLNQRIEGIEIRIEKL